MNSSLPKRIVFHTASLRGGGAERVFVLMANEMAARGHDVTLFTWNADGPNASLLSTKVKLVNLGFTIRGESYGKPATLSGILRSAQFFTRHKPDAVFSAPEFANLIMALALILARSSAKFYPSFHASASLPSSGLGARIAMRLAALVSSRATKGIAVSAGVGRDVVARGFSPSKITVINNPLPPPAPRSTEAYPWNADLAAMAAGPVIVSVGRLVPVKDHRTLLKAFAQFLVSKPARLVIFGEGPLENALRAYSRELGIDRQVLFAGYVNDPAACYDGADLLVVSSTSEGFGNVLIEAMAAGVPVVSTDAPHGPREILDGGRFGPLVPVGDASSLATAMDQTLDQPIPPAELKRRAADFGIDKIGDRYEALL